MFYKKAALETFAIFTGKYLALESLFNKVAGLKACDFVKKRLQYRCYPVNTANFLRTHILKNICEWLLLNNIPIFSAEKVSKFRVFSSPYFTISGLNTEIETRKTRIGTLFTQCFGSTSFTFCSHLQNLTFELDFIKIFSESIIFMLDVSEQ